jgi:hypothetical protein
MRATAAQVRVPGIALAFAFQRLLWVDSGLSRPLLASQSNNLLCWLIALRQVISWALNARLGSKPAGRDRQETGQAV